MKVHSILTSRWALGCGIALLTASALAQPGDCGPMGGWEKFHEQRMDRMQQHQKTLHDALKLSPDQEEAWKKFTQSMPPTARMAPPAPEDWSKLTSPQRAEKMLELSKQRHERMSEHVEALKSFYAVLTPEQQKIFDAQHPGPRAGRHGPRRMPGDGKNMPAPGPSNG